jgi:histidinol-phosphatase (PHP family)
MNNYHTHTYRCRHASGDVADYVAAAAAAGLAELGFSDHCPYPDGRWPENRMSMADLPGYLEALKEAKALAAAEAAAATVSPAATASPAKPASPRIFAGLECEWGPEIEAFIREEFLGSCGLDYLVAGIHCYLHKGQWRDSYEISRPSELVGFAETSCGAMESGLFSFLAHPDVFCYNWMPWDENAASCARDILATSARTGVPVEINGYGFRKGRVLAPEGRRRPYPHEEFWRLAAEYGVSCVVNSDAHRPVDTAANLDDGREIARKFGLTLIETLPPRPKAAPRP